MARRRWHTNRRGPWKRSQARTWAPTGLPLTVRQPSPSLLVAKGQRRTRRARGAMQRLVLLVEVLEHVDAEAFGLVGDRAGLSAGVVPAGMMDGAQARAWTGRSYCEHEPNQMRGRPTCRVIVGQLWSRSVRTTGVSPGVAQQSPSATRTGCTGSPRPDDVRARPRAGRPARAPPLRRCGATQRRPSAPRRFAANAGGKHSCVDRVARETVSLG